MGINDISKFQEDKYRINSVFAKFHEFIEESSYVYT